MKKKTKSNRVSIKELKNSFRAYLSDVKSGATFLVTEHDTVVAELRPALSSVELDNPVLASWIIDGLVTPPVRVKAIMPKSFLSLPNGTAL